MKPLRGNWVFLILVAFLTASIVLAFSGTLNSYTTTTPPKKARSAEFGKVQAELHKSGVVKPAIVPFIRTLSSTRKSNRHCPCPAVFQMQRALKAAKVRPMRAKATGVFGKATRNQVKAFQTKNKISSSGIYGRVTHQKLQKYYDLVGRKRLQALARNRKLASLYRAFLTVGEHARIVGGTTLTYSQSASRAILPAYPRLPPATDCSGFVTWMFKAVGLPDPNGFGFSPVGYTGTLAQHGVRVTNWNDLHAGDLVFYGGGYPYGHVAVIWKAKLKLVLSHGSRGVKVVAFNYRVVSVIKRYY